MSVVVAYTPDEFGIAALESGIDQARAGDGRVVVVNATRGDAYVDPHWASAEHVADLERRLADAGVDGHVRQDVARDVAGAVLDVATAEHATLVVVGIRHRSPVGKAIMGSVAQQIILDAEVPVLAVKPAR